MLDDYRKPEPSALVNSNLIVHPPIVKRVTGEKITVPIVIGSIAQALRRPISVPGEDWSLSHKWGCYIRGLRETNNINDPMEEQDLSYFIQKVEFKIHESFPQHEITIY
jgi:transcription initiation factor IIF auxiliary subunit